jgi:hypothetical protein
MIRSVSPARDPSVPKGAGDDHGIGRRWRKSGATDPGTVYDSAALSLQVMGDDATHVTKSWITPTAAAGLWIADNA